MSQTKCQLFDVSVEGPTALKNGANDATLDGSGNLSISAGNLVLASGSGIDFSATADGSGTMTSELLDDYEEGTFTPTPATGTASAGDGNYVKVGSYVHASGYVRFADITSAGSDVIINNLPFVANERSTGSVFCSYLDAGKIPNAVYVNPSTTNMYFYISGTGVYAALEHDEINNSSNQFFFTVGYRTNA